MLKFGNRSNLPADPDGMNDSRAAWAEQALAEFMQATGTDREDALGDLLCDLMHWADRNDQNFNSELESARRCYEEETYKEEE